MFCSIRQFMYPKEFRISPIRCPKEPPNSSNQTHESPIVPEIENNDMNSFIKEVSTNLWRIKNRLESEDDPSHDVLSALRFVQITWDILTQKGVEITDHTNQRIIGGEMLRILSYESVEYLDHTKVIETIKPTISINNKTIQIGEVIVGTPNQEQMNEIHSNEMVS